MDTITVTTTDELLALRNSVGVIDINGDFNIQCDVPWRNAGRHISWLNVIGNLYCGGDMHCGGYLHCGGTINKKEI